jgi:nitrite reductase/ring-hydroxylating ferredoxin subunit
MIRASGAAGQGWWVAAEAEHREGDQGLGGGEPECDPTVVLLRSGDGIVVLADRCTHRGGPLHEGELAEGCVVCPWHGSVFAVDGSVVEGPATRPQPAYEVRVTDGKVYARRSGDPRSLRTNPVGV